MASPVDAADAAALTEVGVGYGLVVDDSLLLTISIFRAHYDTTSHTVMIPFDSLNAVLLIP